MKAAKTVGAVVTSLGLVVGLSGFAGATSGVIGYTGPWSSNHIDANLRNNAEFNNDNNLNVNTNNDQRAESGDASVDCNNQGGDAVTGDAFNANSTNVSASVFNGTGNGAGWIGGGWGDGLGNASIDTTGPNSFNSIDFDVNNNLQVRNNNDVNVQTHNNQTAYSGDANVSGNTFGGSAITGNASNTNSTSVNLNVSN